MICTIFFLGGGANFLWSPMKNHICFKPLFWNYGSFLTVKQSSLAILYKWSSRFIHFGDCLVFSFWDFLKKRVFSKGSVSKRELNCFLINCLRLSKKYDMLQSKIVILFFNIFWHLWVTVFLLYLLMLQ